MTVSTLPRIVEFLGTDDAGDMSANCPHCGADGRYIHRFRAITTEGEIVFGGAMAGCIKLYPTSWVAEEHRRIAEKQREYEKKGWKLNSWDLDALDALAKFYTGIGSEADITSYLKNLRQSAADWRKSRTARR